ncbi:MAG: DNA primase [Gammaproteobacteria bacterium]
MSGGRIPRAFIDDLLARVDIVDLIDSRLPLKKTGTNFVARCPFHTEKTPSFSVNRNKQFYHCFGCGASGNAISFLMDFHHLNFVEAIEDLAAYAGLDVPRESATDAPPQKKSDLSALYGLMEQAARFYAEQLRTYSEGKKAVDYLNARGVTDEVIEVYQIGYAPVAWRNLLNRFEGRLLKECGLLGQGETGELYGRFRGRVMFPIRDKRGHVIGFGGRVLDDSMPKYLNSPETPLFYKGREVYGLYELLETNAKPKRILIVEGYMDVIALAQYGIRYAVATLGTAASQAHLELLFRYTSELVFCFDGDKAGREAAWRAMDPVFPCLREGRQVRVLLLPEDEDPDSMVRKEGLAGFVERVESAETLSDYFFVQLSLDLNLATLEGKARLVKTAAPYLEKLPAGVFRDMMFVRLKELSGYDALDVSKNEATLKQRMRVGAMRPERGRLSAARMAIALLLQNPGLAEMVEQKDIDWEGLEFPGVALFKHVLGVISKTRPANSGVLLEAYRGLAEEKSVKALVFLPLLVPPEGIEREFGDALDRLLAQSKSAALDRLLTKGRMEGLSREEKESLRKLLMQK